jgi:predicted dienelactone hydrolase
MQHFTMSEYVKFITFVLINFYLYNLSLIAEVNQSNNGIIEQHDEIFDENRDRKIPIKIYYKKSNSPQPIIIYSHGLGGSRNNNRYLGTFWSKHEYICIFIQHTGSDEKVWKDSPPTQRLQNLRNATKPKYAILRFQDVPATIDQLFIWNKSKKHLLSQKMNLKKIGLCGHSYGALTTLALAGQQYPQKMNFLDKRISAFFAMSPKPIRGYSARESFSHITSPILIMTGTKDLSPVDKSLKASDRLKVYQNLPKGDKYQLNLYGAQHHAFGDRRLSIFKSHNKVHHRYIQQISTKFWDVYLKDLKVSKKWLQLPKPITSPKLHTQDTWDWK